METAELNAIQHQAIQLLASGTSVAATARQLCIDRTTIYVWRKNDPCFSYYLRRAQSIQNDQVQGDLLTYASAPRTVLNKITRPAPKALTGAELDAAVESVVGPPRLSPRSENSTQFDTIRHFRRVESVESHVETQAPATSTNVGRNEPCPCDSSLKYKRCCGNPATANQQQRKQAA